MKLDRTVPPVIRPLGEFEIARPERMEMKNGIPLNIIHAGSQEVVRLDILVWGGQCQQEQPLQAMFTNRMLREGTSSFTSQEIAEKLGCEIYMYEELGHAAYEEAKDFNKRIYSFLQK